MSMLQVNELTSVILAGGLGTRLAHIVSDVPKPLAPVAGRPFLEYLIQQIRAAGCTDVVICVGHQAELISRHLGDGGRYGVNIQYSYEKTLLGTAGALVLARNLIQSESFLVFNGDTYCSVDLQELAKQHGNLGALATIVTAQVDDADRYGSVIADDRDAITHFLEKAQSASHSRVNAGIYLLNKSIVSAIEPGARCSLETDVFPSLVGCGLFAYSHAQSFIDIGTPDSYSYAQTHLPLLAGFGQHQKVETSD